MSGWQPIDTAPKDGGSFEVKMIGQFPVVGYYGGGQDKAIREWNSCRQIVEAEAGTHLQSKTNNQNKR